ncbi:Ig-like domain-containing protein [Paenibacillus flagellatus]|uniref:Uncharacterized protein n=1 Tax=Paenibacillus flagellatus TaxID=2211139 RepID=A0A2V5KMT7_9BACL|nr:Ig-like domain-containing protein [Paenibacillus flagellatus]PYI56550.1 hypothetical protein DLM86_06165 [Paenibacillus flagellatus]
MKRKKSRVFSWAFALALAVACSSAAPVRAGAEEAASAAGGVLSNGGFEAGTVDGGVPGWGPDGAADRVSVSETVYAEGKRSLRITDHSPTQSFGAISDPVPAAPFDNVVLNVKVRPESGGGGKVDLRFYDAAGKPLSVVSGLVSGPAGQWSDLRVAASAPKDGATVRVAIYFPNESAGTLYADDARLAVSPLPGTVTNLGPQSTALTIMTGAYGKDKDGRDVMYTVVQGDPARLVVTDVATKQIRSEYPLVAADGGNSTAAWAITVASDNKAYAGSTPNGTLFQYDPERESVRAIGKPVASDTVIWTLVPGPDGKVYGGTGYSQSLIEYDPALDRTRVLASFKTSSKEQHIRSLAYDPDRNAIYVGGADVAKLYRYDLTTGAKTPLTIPEFAGKTSVYDLRYTAGKLFVRADPGPVMFVYDPATQTWPVKNETAYNARGFSPVSPDNRVFYTFYETMPDGRQQWSLYAYDVATGAYGSLGVDVKGAGVAFGYVRLNDPDFPGVTLTGLAGNGGRAFYYNLETGRLDTPELDLPPQFVELYNIGKSSDGKMLSSGFISGGGLGLYDPLTGTTERKPSLGQVEGFGSLNGNMYFGVYPRATIFEYDPSKPWNRTDPSAPNNPLRLGQLGDEQDRPLSMVGVEETNKLYIGTYPIAGKTGGALSIYDATAKTFTVRRNIVPDHSINSLLYKDGKLYMGTGDMSAGGGGGKIAVYDTATGTVERELVPAPGKKAVTSLIWGPDGNIWGMALGVLFVYDPAADRIVYRDDKFPAADYAHTNPGLMVGKDGNVYGSIFLGYVADKTYTSKMFVVDAATKQMTIIAEGNVEKLTMDDFGHFYFKYGSELMRYSDPKLVTRLTGIEFAERNVRLAVGDSYPLQAIGRLSDGSAIALRSGVAYASKNESVAGAAESGGLLARKPGSTVITATFGGMKAEMKVVVDPKPKPGKP